MAENEEKKVEGEEGPPPEAVLETEKQRDPDEAVFAEQAIHHYATQVLEQFRQSVETALSSFTAWVESQNATEVFDNAGFNAQIGDVFLQQMMSACGGQQTPIGASMYGELEGLVDWAAREEQETSFFVESLSRAARDYTWYLRDNLQGVLTNEWDQLRDLAYEGSTDFIPALHAFGMPKAEWSPAGMSSTMVAIAEKVRDGTPKTQEEAVEKDPAQQEEEEKQVLAEQEDKKQAV
jgi:DNA-binding protein Fis